MFGTMAEKKHEGNSPKRRKLSSYVYKTFFEEGRDSDIKIIALNREWPLQKSFLSRSPYFRTMFSGSWVEKKLKEISLGIEDENITAEALHKVLGSLYSDEIQVEPTEAVPILACATFLQLDDLIIDCTETMKVCINKNTAVRFFEAAERYSIEEVKNVAFNWLCRNMWKILHEFDEFPHFFYMMSEDLMKKLLTSSDLCVDEELDVFQILISWTYLKEKSSDIENEYEDNWEEIYDSSLDYFRERYGKGKPFLETDSGIPYQSLFRAVRIKYLIIDELYFEDIEDDHIFPAEWYMPVIKTQWYSMLRIHTGLDKGPDILVSEEVFDRECMRISGYIEGERKTRIWSSRKFDFGFGLGFRYENGCFKIKRKINSNNNSVVGPVSSNRRKRDLMYRLSLFSADNDGRVLSKAETGIQTVSMAPNDEIEVLSFKPLKDSLFQYRINFLLTTP